MQPIFDTEHVADVLAAAAVRHDLTARESAAYTRAEEQLRNGLRVTPSLNGWLVPSRTTAGNVYRVQVTEHPDGDLVELACSCEAGRAHRRCWHVALVEAIEASKEIA
jgi:hypothetical protein